MRYMDWDRDADIYSSRNNYIEAILCSESIGSRNYTSDMRRSRF